MPRVLIIAAAVIAAVVAVFYVVWRKPSAPTQERIAVERMLETPAVQAPVVPLQAKPPSDALPAEIEEATELQVVQEIAPAESLRTPRTAEETLPFFDRQALLDAIEGPGTDNARVIELGGQLRGVNLQKADLKLIDLRGVEAPEADFSGAQLQGAELSQASMPGARLSGADLTGANLDGIDLRGAHLEGVTFKVSARGADLRGVRMNGATLDGADLTGADMRSAYLIDSSIGAVLRQADLRYADMRRADLLGVDLTDANLEKANLLDVGNLTCDQLQRARNWATTLRPSDLACGQPIPEPTKDQAEN